jgi:hypothetical protein
MRNYILHWIGPLGVAAVVGIVGFWFRHSIRAEARPKVAKAAKRTRREESIEDRLTARA